MANDFEWVAGGAPFEEAPESSGVLQRAQQFLSVIEMVLVNRVSLREETCVSFSGGGVGKLAL